MRRLSVIRHRTANQVRAAYRTCHNGVEKTRWHALWLLLRTDVPRTPAQVAEVVGVSAVSVRAALRRWNEYGPEGLTDRRAANRGRLRAILRGRLGYLTSSAILQALIVSPSLRELAAGSRPRVGRAPMSAAG